MNNMKACSLKVMRVNCIYVSNSYEETRGLDYAKND